LSTGSTDKPPSTGPTRRTSLKDTAHYPSRRASTHNDSMDPLNVPLPSFRAKPSLLSIVEGEIQRLSIDMAGEELSTSASLLSSLEQDYRDPDNMNMEPLLRLRAQSKMDDETLSVHEHDDLGSEGGEGSEQDSLEGNSSASGGIIALGRGMQLPMDMMERIASNVKRRAENMRDPVPRPDDRRLGGREESGGSYRELTQNVLRKVCTYIHMCIFIDVCIQMYVYTCIYRYVYTGIYMYVYI
jgi:hypothetical protein